MVVEAAPVIPGNDDRGIGPIRTVPDGVDDRGHPRWAGALVARGMIGIRSSWRDPGDGWQVLRRNVLQYLRAYQCDMGGPVGAVPDMLNRVRPIPDPARALAVITPVDIGSIQLVGQGGMFKAGECSLRFVPVRINPPYRGSRC